MKKKRKPGYFTLLALSILWVLGALLTIMPAPMMYRECMLGYKAHCTLTPISTVTCVVLAGVTCLVQTRLFIERS